MDAHLSSRSRSSRTSTSRDHVSSFKDIDTMNVEEILSEKSRLEAELKATEDEIMEKTAALTERSRLHRRSRKNKHKKTTPLTSRSDVSSVASSLADDRREPDDLHSGAWTGRSASWQLSTDKRDKVLEAIELQRQKHRSRTKKGVTHQMDSRLMGSLLFSGHVGDTVGKTEKQESFVPVKLTPREVQQLAEGRRSKGEFTAYMNASIKKNVNVAASGHC